MWRTFIFDKTDQCLNLSKTRVRQLGNRSIQGVRAIDLWGHGGHKTFDLHECGCREAQNSCFAMANDAKRQLGYDAIRFIQMDVRQIDAT